jgi:hypothetical protein
MRSVGRARSGEDRFFDVFDGVVECREDGAVAFGGVVNDAGEHRRQPGTDQLRVVRQVLADALQHGPLAVNADHEPVAENQLHLPGPDFLLGRLPPDRLDRREQQFADHLQGRPFGHRAQLLDQRPRQAELPLDRRQLLGAGVAEADPDEAVAGRRRILAARPVLVGGSRVCHHASRLLPRAAVASGPVPA